MHSSEWLYMTTVDSLPRKRCEYATHNAWALQNRTRPPLVGSRRSIMRQLPRYLGLPRPRGFPLDEKRL